MRNHHARRLEDRMTCKANYVSICKYNYAVIIRDILLFTMINYYNYLVIIKNTLTDVIKCVKLYLHFIRMDGIMKQKDQDQKREALKKHGVLHKRPEQVTDELFQQGDFFDPRDLVQVKYEMLRRVRVDGMPIRAVAHAFGFSRPSLYKAKSAFERDSLVGLVPAKTGPRRAHKLNEAVITFIKEERDSDASLPVGKLAGRIKERFGLVVHPRSIERTLQRKEKKAK